MMAAFVSGRRRHGAYPALLGAQGARARASWRDWSSAASASRDAGSMPPRLRSIRLHGAGRPRPYLHRAEPGHDGAGTPSFVPFDRASRARKCRIAPSFRGAGPPRPGEWLPRAVGKSPRRVLCRGGWRPGKWHGGPCAWAKRCAGVSGHDPRRLRAQAGSWRAASRAVLVLRTVLRAAEFSRRSISYDDQAGLRWGISSTGADDPGLYRSASAARIPP